MAYTSTLGLALSAGAYETLRARIAALDRDRKKAVRELVRYADAHRTRRGAHCLFWNSVPWSDEDHERSFLESVVRSLPPGDFHLCRVGDDPADNEEEGSFPDPFDLRLRREVTLG
jgi:hypothetical protein